MMNLVQTAARITIWAASAPTEQDDAAGEQRSGAATNAAALKVLIVEDEFFIALDIQAQVEALGHAVVGIAVSADQAIALTAREKPDVVLMDIRLSGPRDGIDAAIEIRQRSGLDIIFVTANTDPGTLERARSVNPLGVLQKPLTQPRLRNILAARAGPRQS